MCNNLHSCQWLVHLCWCWVWGVREDWGHLGGPTTTSNHPSATTRCSHPSSPPFTPHHPNQHLKWPRVNIAYLRPYDARASFVNNARICGTNFWRDLTRIWRARVIYNVPEKNWEIWRAFDALQYFARFSKFCPIFKILPDFQNFARFSKFC